MRTLRLKVEDSVFDKVMYFLQKLPKNEVEIIEDKSLHYNDEDFIAHIVANPVEVHGEFLTREEAHER